MLVVYLHGGSSKGNDNEKQIQEEAVGLISSYLAQNHKKALMIVPQCPNDKSWLGSMLAAVRYLIKDYTDRGSVDLSRIYILGGSMGGTGTWNMLSSYPDVFAAAMPVAGNPTGLNAANVAKTPLYTVMGTADRIMKLSAVQDFLQLMDIYGAEYQIESEEGWSHEDTCKKSYTNERLDWVFRHIKGSNTGIEPIDESEHKVCKIFWFSINGQRLMSEPHQPGLYIKKSILDNGEQKSEKIYKVK